MRLYRDCGRPRKGKQREGRRRERGQNVSELGERWRVGRQDKCGLRFLWPLCGKLRDENAIQSLLNLTNQLKASVQREGHIEVMEGKIVLTSLIFAPDLKLLILHLRTL